MFQPLPIDTQDERSARADRIPLECRPSDRHSRARPAEPAPPKASSAAVRDASRLSPRDATSTRCRAASYRVAAGPYRVAEPLPFPTCANANRRYLPLHPHRP